MPTSKTSGQNLILPTETDENKPSTHSTNIHVLGNEITELGSNFVPGKYDVLCSRGKVAWSHYGNVFLRELVALNANRYNAAKSRLERTILVSEIVDYIRSRGTGFVKQELNSDNWIEVGDDLAREKIGQMMRNILGSFRSSLKSKTAMRKVTTSRLAQRTQQVMSTNKKVVKTIEAIKDDCDSSVGQMSDEQALQLLTRQNLAVLSIIKENNALRAQFLDAEAAVYGDNCSQGDSD